MSELGVIILSAAVSILSVSCIFKRILRIANITGILDYPDARKLQSSPVPVMGGIAVFFGLATGMLVHGALSSVIFGGGFSANPDIGTVIIASVILLYLGAVDDVLNLSPLFRLIVQILVVLAVILTSGMSIDSFHGLWGIEELPGYVSLPLTVFACVGIINAFNMIDGINGLSSGLCMALSCIVGIVFYKRFDFDNAAFVFCYSASLFPFYLHNVFGKESKMYIGDAGTMVMGIIVSWLSIKMLSSQSEVPVPEHGRDMCIVALMLAVVSVPVADAVRVMVCRIFRGKSPFSPDKNHLHHAFISAGVSHFVTHLSEIAINLMIVGIWLVSYRSGLSQELQLFITIVSTMMLVWGTYFFLHYQEIHQTRTFVRFKKWSSFTHLGNKTWWKNFQKMIDSL